MTHGLGLVFWGLGLLLIANGLRAHRRKTEVGAAGGSGRRVSPLANFGIKARAFIVALLVYTAIKATVVYVVFDGSRMLSILDLAGFLFLLAAYGTWFILRTSTARPIHPAPNPAPRLLRHEARPETVSHS